MKKSSLERKFELYWKGLNGPPLSSEEQFCATRKWRADFAHTSTKTLIEIEGGIWIKSRHTTGCGFTADCEKYNEAAFLGWTTFRLTGDHITTPIIERLINYIRRKENVRPQ